MVLNLIANVEVHVMYLYAKLKPKSKRISINIHIQIYNPREMEEVHEEKGKRNWKNENMKGGDDGDYKMEKSVHHLDKILVTTKILNIYTLC